MTIEYTYSLAILFALITAGVDALLVLLHQPIRHSSRVGLRAGIALGYLMWLAMLAGQLQWLHLVNVVGGSAVASAAFRGWMNLLREKPLAYISTSNATDRWWMRRARTLGLADEKGGHLAYLVEYSVALLCALVASHLQ
ncbi:MAG: hypothetical protein JNL05_10485 [Flavobacteriales bacterium]|nr:hypothetical protein [Flavobacteriales bacterium]